MFYLKKSETIVSLTVNLSGMELLKTNKTKIQKDPRNADDRK